MELWPGRCGKLAIFREIEQVNILKLMRTSFPIIGGGTYAYGRVTARRIPVVLVWDRRYWCGIHSFQYK